MKNEDNFLVIVTGASRGIGHSILKNLSEMIPFSNPVGIVRGTEFSAILGVQYEIMDLRFPENAEEVMERIFSFISPAIEKAVLINCAGVLTPLTRVTDTAVNELQTTFNVNYHSPVALTAAFLKKTRTEIFKERTVINITSGAARHPYSGWNAYCSTKSALDMFTRVAAMENDDGKTVITAVAPGIVETHMQQQIRSSDSAVFPEKEKFIKLHHNNMLRHPDDVSTQILTLLRDDEFQTGMILDLRDLIAN
ncbi:MAG: SDR family NAD(P)-dependent oxidoreductase [Deltaproteobacteria bacterium]|nr:SDR family NAD(P)-dependent oxidoreductase [Deltaproteobacteria bacterium]